MMLGSAEHVPLVHEVFTPTAEEIAYWRELDELAAEAERVNRGPIRHGDPRQGEAHVVHIAHVGSARKNLAWARDLGVIADPTPSTAPPRPIPASVRRLIVRSTDAGSWSEVSEVAEELEDLGRGEVLLEDDGAARAQRVGDGIAQRGGRADGAAFADAAEVDRALRG